MRLILFFLLITSMVTAQPGVKEAGNPVARPKLVVGIVVDQMRWDFLYRYYNRYAADGGFKRLINQGFSCENTFIDYIPTYTACGHACIYTGSVPAVNGITGNGWYDLEVKESRYCTEDKSEKGLGTDGEEGRMSPRNMKSTTICDELRYATNFRSKVIGIAIKDRGSILSAGHSATAAYWFDGSTGHWISSTYYMKVLPAWITAFNDKKLPGRYLEKGWNTLYPINTYQQSTADDMAYEGKPFGPDAGVFPYLNIFNGKNYGVLASTPFGNSLTKDLAIAALDAEQLGKDTITDFLTVSFSSTDYVGHVFGPNSIEVEDTYLRLDKDLGELFRSLDKKVGKNQYLLFISADHGVAHAPGFEKANNIPGGSIGDIDKPLDSALKKQFGNFKFITANTNSQLYFNHRLLDSLRIDQEAFAKYIIDFISVREGIDQVVAISKVAGAPIIDAIKRRIINGYYPSRSGDIQIIYKPGWMGHGSTGTTHGSWNPYDTHIPLIWYGWNIKPGKTNRENYMTDIAPTIAALLHIQMPSGSVGKVIEEIGQ